MITKSQAFYIESHFEQKTPQELAADTGLKIRQINSYIKKLQEAGVKQLPPQNSGLDASGFATRNGTVSMTQKASAVASDGSALDEDGKKKEVNKEFFDKKVKNGVHIINKNQPVF
jgi:hypothetical protein